MREKTAGIELALRGGCDRKSYEQDTFHQLPGVPLHEPNCLIVNPTMLHGDIGAVVTPIHAG